jgi:hypothetical protein
MQTLALDANWDVFADAVGNIAVATEPYALAQDAASAVKTFAGEVYYNTSLGIPYFADVLGKMPPLELLREYFIAAALTVPGVASATVFFSSISKRTVTGQINITDNSGVTTSVGF